MQLTQSECAVEKEKKQGYMGMRDVMLLLSLVLLLTVAVRSFVFTFVGVEGPSMKGTLLEGEQVAVLRCAYWFSLPQRGDVVTCSYPQRDEQYVKRVIGLPGEMIMIREGTVYVDGRPVPSGGLIIAADEDYGPTRVPEGSYFVMGDNRPVSGDSRLESVGALPLSMINGKVLAVVLPLENFSAIGGL